MFYLHNITHDVYAGDIGDIATAAAVFGVPHPPGYPLITFIGFLLSKLPLPLPIISRISLVSLIASISGSFIFLLFVWKQSKSIVITFLSTGILSFSYYYWLYAEIPEVFALNNFFVIIQFISAYQFYKTKKLIYLYITGLLVGLSLANQQAILFTFPGLAVFIFPELWRIVFKGKNIEMKTSKKLSFNQRWEIIRNTLLAIAVGLIPYVYVFLAASTHPVINWMNEPTIYNFIRLLLRMDYPLGQTPISLSQRVSLQSIYFSTLLTTLSTVLVIICILGIIQLWRKDRRLLSASVVGFLFAGPIFLFIITPEIIDADELGIVERMFMQSFILFIFFLPFGLIAFKNFFDSFLSRKIYAYILLIPFIIVLGQMMFYNFPKTDLSGTKIGSNFVHDILGPLPKHSLVFLLGDLGTLNSWYVHYVEGYRPDLIFAGSYGDRNDFEQRIVLEYKKSHKDTKLSNEAIVISKLPDILKQRKVYSMYFFPLGRKDYIWLPRGLVYELVPVNSIPTKNEYIAQSGRIIKQYHIAYRDRLLPSEQNNIAPYISKQYSNAFNFIGDFVYVHYDDRRSAFSYYSTAQIIDPENPLTYAKIGIVDAELPGQCKQAVDNIDTAITMYKIYRPYYTFALRIYQKCGVNKNKIKDMELAYKKLFGKELEKDLHY